MRPRSASPGSPRSRQDGPSENNTAAYVWIFVVGVGIGGLTGLSASPVLQTVLVSAMAITASVIAALCNVTLSQTTASTGDQHHHAEDDKKEHSGDSTDHTPQERPVASTPLAHRHIRVATAPLGLLVIGLTIGAPLGVLARTHEVFGLNPARTVDAWSITGWKKDLIAQKLFDHLYPSGGKEGRPTHVGSLTDVPSPEECASLQAATDDKDLLRTMNQSSVKRIRDFADRHKTQPNVLKDAITLVCGSTGPQ